MMEKKTALLSLIPQCLYDVQPSPLGQGKEFKEAKIHFGSVI